MKRWVVGLLGLGALVTGAALVRQVMNPTVSADTGPTEPPNDCVVLDVDPFMENVDRFRGPVRVTGVVNTASAADHMLTLIDRREFEECGVTTCAKLYLPVRWSGAMPESGQTVRVEGQVNEDDGKLVLVARTLESLNPPRPPERP
ncbi:MAG: hypothetical protein JSW71_07290 [Gemmatimonadota bacterium]|nr:MAG: hypothetical protein JSW71_07290 [Gemmatimonadota bacterium]